MASDIQILSLTAVGGVGQIALSAIAASPLGMTCLPYMIPEKIEFWAASTNDRGSATKIGESPVGLLVHEVAGEATRYYWARAVDPEGNLGAFYPVSATGGVAGTTKTVVPPDGSITEDKLAPGSVTKEKFVTGITPVEIVASLPTSGNYAGRTVFYNGRLWRHTGSPAGSDGFSAAVASTDISGQIANAQIEALAASKITGQLTDAQLEEIDAAKLTGQITETQISSNAITTAKIAAGAVEAAKIAAGAIVAEKIAADAVTAAKIEAGAVETAKLAAGAITTAKIAAGAVTADEIAADAVVATKIASNAITTDKIDAGAVSAAKISVTNLAAINANLGSITAGSLSASVSYLGTVNASQINATTLSSISANLGTITAGTINGITITGGTVRTSSGSTRVEMSQSDHALTLYAGVTIARISATAAERGLFTAGSGVAVACQGSGTGNGHGLRGSGSGSGGGRGLVGITPTGGNYAFYSESGGYGPFTGAHDALLPKNVPVEIGDIVCSADKVWAKHRVDDALLEVRVPETEKDRGAYGIVTQILELDEFAPLAGLPSMYGKDTNYPTPVRKFLKERYTRLVVNGVGEGLVSVCGRGGNIEVGDYICTSSMRGKGQRQNDENGDPDDFHRRCTVARATQSVTFDDPDQVKLIACVYQCG